MNETLAFHSTRKSICFLEKVEKITSLSTCLNWILKNEYVLKIVTLYATGRKVLKFTVQVQVQINGYIIYYSVSKVVVI